MPTLATGISTDPRRRRRSAGFTLIELLVVMFIIGLLVSLPLLSVNLGGREQRLQQEAERLWQLLRLASEEALLQGRQLGLRVEPGGYRFLVMEQAGGPWTELGDEDRLRRRELPEDVEIRLEIEGLRVVLEEATDRPQVFVLSSGEVLPAFAIELLDRETDELWRIEPGRLEEFSLVAERF